MINIPWGNDFALKVPIKKKVIQTTGEIEIQDFDVSSVEQLHVFLQHNEHLPDWHSSQVEWSADPENSSGIIVEVSSQMAPIGMYNIILTGVQNERRFFSQQCRQFKIIGNASSSDLVIYEGIQTYTLEEVIVLDARGRDGLSAYELAVARGFEGTESEWMATLKGENGNGVAGVGLIEQVGNVDHYRMTFTNGTYFDYTVTNSSGTLTPEQIAEIVTELSNTITAGDLNAYTKTEVNNLLNSKAGTSDIPTSLSDLNDDATHRTVTDTEKQVWNNKQEPISDLSTIRQNASNAYQKPNTGIPLSDLSEEVQDAIENAGSLTEETDPIFTASPAHAITSSDISNWNGKQPALTFDSTPTAGSNNPVTSAGIKAYVDNATPTLTMDDTPTSGSSNPVKSSGIYNALQGKQNTLTFDSTPTASSTNPVTSGGVKAALDLKANQSTTYTKTEVDGLLEDVAILADDDGQATTLSFDPQADTVWNIPQTLGSSQQAQARANIGVVDVSGTNDGTNWTSITIGSTTKAIPSGGSSGDENVIEGIKMNNTSLTPDANKVVDLGTVITSHQDISGKADKSEMGVSTSGDQTTITLKSGTSATVINAHQSLTGKQDVLVSGTNIKTINNESLLGSGNITVSSGGGGDVNVIEGITFNGTAATIDSTTKNAAISYTPPVTSVNNQTGAVSLSIPTESTVSGWGFTKNTGNVSSTTITTIVSLTEAAYTALATKDSSTLYVIIES